MTEKLYYPKRNIIGVEPEWELRRLSKILRIDLTRDPLPLADFLRRPLVRRGRWLLRAWDMDAGQWRQFYECGFKHMFREPPLRVGVRKNSRVVSVSREYAATVYDRRRLAVTVHQLKAREDLFIYADDLQIVKVA